MSGYLSAVERRALVARRHRRHMRALVALALTPWTVAALLTAGHVHWWGR